MLPMNSNGTVWQPHNVRLMSRRVRMGARDDLRARDEKNGILASNGWKVYRQASGAASTTGNTSHATGRYVADRHLSSLKHTGRDLRLLHASRWATFCSKPQDESQCDGARDSDRRVQLDAMIAAGAGVDLRSLRTQIADDGTHAERVNMADPVPVLSPSVPGPAKRGPGRPPGSKNKPS